MGDDLKIDTQVSFHDSVLNRTLYLDDVYKIEIYNSYIRVYTMDGVFNYECASNIQLNGIFV